MIMITGGAYQGKEELARSVLGIPEEDMLDGGSCSPGEALAAACIKNYQELIRKLEQSGMDPVSFTEGFCSANKDAVVIMDEVGCGIVPLEKSERTWREDCGRCGTLIAANSQTVYRVCCGIASVIKKSSEAQPHEAASLRQAGI